VGGNPGGGGVHEELPTRPEVDPRDDSEVQVSGASTEGCTLFSCST